MNRKLLILILSILVILTMSIGVLLLSRILGTPTGKSPEDSTGKPLEISGPQKTDPTANWNLYENGKYGYSFKYPEDCFYGQLPDHCKQKAPEDWGSECLCCLDAENLDAVLLQTFTGEKTNLNEASIIVAHYPAEFDDLSAGTDLMQWLEKELSETDLEILDKANIEIAGIPAVKIYTPPAPGVYSQEYIYFMKDNKLFQISMLDPDNDDNRALYDKILSTFAVIQ